MNKEKQIADYGWVGKNQRIWLGNPFYVAMYRVPLKKMTENKIIRKIKEFNKKGKEKIYKIVPRYRMEMLEGR